jgi:hypothetical protein
MIGKDWLKPKTPSKTQDSASEASENDTRKRKDRVNDGDDSQKPFVKKVKKTMRQFNISLKMIKNILKITKTC